ncbi:phytosulfokines-like [Curcuma longa]|uniref:phytosulfokines-like n=1 Tax=Curcuma longa TaxID=136217 RepID=UPI003D9F11D6
MSKSTALLLLIALLLFASLAEAARHEPADPANAQQQVGESESEEMEEGCEQVGEDECLMRRTLAAHTDYIYTQGKGKKH